MARLATGLWVSAYLARLQAEGIFVFVPQKGDGTAGAVIIKVATLDGRATAYRREMDVMTGARPWAVLTQGPERDVDESLAKQASFDPDLWIVEIEDRHGRHLLDQPGLAE